MTQDAKARDLAIHPLPWRVEEDWTAEVRDAVGDVVCKLPSGDPRAYAIVAAVNGEQDARRYQAVRKAIGEGLQIVATDENNHIIESFVGWDNSHDPPAHLDSWADLLIARGFTPDVAQSNG